MVEHYTYHLWCPPICRSFTWLCGYADAAEGLLAEKMNRLFVAAIAIVSSLG